MDDLIALLDGKIVECRGREMISAREVEDWMLDMRLTLMRETPVEVQEPELVASV